MVDAESQPNLARTSKDQMTAATVAQVRGSGVLLVGRVFALLSSGAVQVLLVRYLTKNDFGEFALGLAVAAIVQRLVSIGHGQCSARFLALYDEARDYDRFYGLLFMVAGAVLSTALALLGMGLLFRAPLTALLAHGDGRAMTLILLLVFYGATEALDDLLGNAFAVCSRPGAIFWRKYVLAPGVRLGVALAVVLLSGGVVVLAIGFLITGVLGVALYIWLLILALRARGLLAHFQVSHIRLPIRQVFGFGLPLVSIEIYNLALNSLGVLLLSVLDGPSAVADLRAVVPLAALNQMVIYTFTTLYNPLATRLAARRDLAAASGAYWQTATWLAVLSFPVLALTAPLARPVTTGLLGAQYTGSAPTLAMLSIGFYANAAFGFNIATLVAFGRVRYLMGVNLACAVVCALLDIALIPPLGALGVGVATSLTVLLQNVLAQAGLRAAAGIRFLEPRYAVTPLTVVGATGGLWILQRALSPGVPLALLLTGGAFLLLLAVNHRRLQVSTAFPELQRIPLVRSFLS